MGGGSWSGISALTKGTPESCLTPSTMGGHPEKAVADGPGRRLSPDTNPLVTCQLPELCK